MYEISKIIFIIALATSLPVSVLPLSRAQENRARKLDEAIQARVEATLKAEGLSQVSVQVKERIVTLSGIVPSLEEKHQAHGVAEDTSEVLQVNNHLTVAPSKLIDLELTRLAQRALRQQGFLDYFTWVEADCARGVVTLRGWVRDAWRPPVYESFIEHIPGIQQVKNEIKVLPQSEADERLRVDIVRAIYNDPILIRYGNRAHPPIHVIVESGKVILKGTVANAEEQKLVGKLAREKCSCAVINQLLVTSPDGRR